MLDHFAEQKSAMDKALKAIAKASKSKAAKNLAAEVSAPMRGKMIAHDLLSETWDLYASKEMSWDEAVDDLSLALKAMDMKALGKEPKEKED